MNPVLETMPPAHESIYQRSVLNENRMNASVIHLEPGQQTEWSQLEGDEHMVFVMQGRPTVQLGELNHVLKQEQCMHFSEHPTATVVVTNQGPTAAKLLRVDVKIPRSEPMLVRMPPA